MCVCICVTGVSPARLPDATTYYSSVPTIQATGEDYCVSVFSPSPHYLPVTPLRYVVCLCMSLSLFLAYVLAVGGFVILADIER